MTSTILMVVLVVLGILCIYFLLKLHDTLTSRQAPTIMTPKSAYGQISDALNIKPGEKITDLGCGDARLLRYLAYHYNQANFVGYENGLLYFVAAKLNCIKYRNIQIIYKNIKSINKIKSDKVYSYLGADMINELVPQFMPGTIVVSVEYAIKDKKPNKIIKLRHHTSLIRKIYMYKF